MCRDPIICPKNHFIYFEDSRGYHIELFEVHFKNDSTKLEATIPISPHFLEKLAYLERGRQAIHPKSPTLFCMMNGDAYNPQYFSTTCAKALTINGVRFTATAMRHMFATVYRDFIHHPSSHLLEHTIEELQASAATLMQNTSTSWDVAYDDSIIDRGVSIALAMWPKFSSFVEEDHKVKKSRKPFDPLTIDIALLKVSTS